MRTDLSLQDEDGWDLPPGHRDEIVVDLPLRFEPLGPAPAARTAPSRNNVLSPAEIDALLRPDFSDLPPLEEPVQVTPRELAELAAAASPEITGHDETVRRLCARLSLALRQGCGLRAAASPLAGKGEDFIAALAALPDERGRATLCFTGSDGEIAAMMALSGALTSRLIDMACGSPSLPTAAPVHALTELDADLLTALLAPLSDAIAPGLTLSRVETDSAFAAALALPGASLIADMMVRAGAGQGAARLIVRDDVIEAPPAVRAQALHVAAEDPRAAGLITVLTARVATLSVALSALSELKAGATLLLGLPSDQPLQILSGGRDGRVVAEGEIGRKGDHMAVRIRRTMALC